MNADVAYLFRPLGLFFTDKVSQYRQRTRLLEHWLCARSFRLSARGKRPASRPAKGAESVTHVSATMCHPCLRPLKPTYCRNTPQLVPGQCHERRREPSGHDRFNASQCRMARVHHQWRRPRGRPVAVNRGEELYRLFALFHSPGNSESDIRWRSFFIFGSDEHLHQRLVGCRLSATHEASTTACVPIRH